MKDSYEHIGNGKSMKQVADARLDGRIDDSQRKVNVDTSPGSVVTRRTMLYSNEKVCSSPSRSAQEATALADSDVRVDRSFQSSWVHVMEGTIHHADTPTDNNKKHLTEQNCSGDPNPGKDHVNSFAKLAGIPSEALAKATVAKKENDGVKIHYDVDLEESAGRLAVAIAIKDDDENIFIPAAVQYDPNAKDPSTRNRRYGLYSLLACTLMLVVVGGLAILLTQKKDVSQDVATESPAENVAVAEVPDRPGAVGIIEKLERIVGSELLADAHGAHVRAKEWLLYKDPLQLTAQDSNVVQRYLLAVVYFQLHEGGEWLSCNAPSDEEPDDTCIHQYLINTHPLEYQPLPWFRWLSGTHECEWAGLYCDEAGEVRAIELMGQEIAGTLPVEFAHFDFLQDIGLSWNKIRGTIPSEYGNMRHLLSFELHNNELTGSIPLGWSRFMALQIFNVGGNFLSGSIPQEFLSISSLKALFLYENMLTGTFPSEISQMELLTYVRMHGNFFTGTLPSEIGLISPRELWIHNLPLKGPIPSEIGNMVDLMDLRVYSTALTGEIPEELWNLSQLFRLELFDTQLSGSLSPNIAQLTDLEVLRLNNATLTGTIPKAVANLPKLETVWLEGNNFVGTVPAAFCAHQTIKELVADCKGSVNMDPPQVMCDCCHICCDHETGVCDNQE